MRLALILFTFITVFISNNLQAHDKEATKTPDTQKKIGVVVKVYSLEGNLSDENYTKIITNNQAEYSPALIVEAGKDAEISIMNPKKISEIDEIKIKLRIDVNVKKYAIDFELYQGESSSTSGMSDADIGRDLFFPAKLNDTSKLIYVKTVVMEGSLSQMLAKNELSIAQSSYMYEQAQQYFQEDKIWDQDLRRYNDLKKNIKQNTRQGSTFFYLTNNDSTRLIKGTAIIKGTREDEKHRASNFFARVQHTGLRNFDFKDNLLHFVILPSQSVLLGRWNKSMQIEIVEADFLSFEETEELKDKYEKNSKD